MRSSETDCITALTMGIFMAISGSSPLLNLTSGVFKLTALGTQSAGVYPGIKRYSLKVCEGSFINLAINILLYIFAILPHGKKKRNLFLQNFASVAKEYKNYIFTAYVHTERKKRTRSISH